MNQRLVSSLQAFLVAVASALVASGVFTDSQVRVWQPVVASLLSVVAALGIHSVRPK